MAPWILNVILGTLTDLFVLIRMTICLQRALQVKLEFPFGHRRPCPALALDRPAAVVPFHDRTQVVEKPANRKLALLREVAQPPEFAVVVPGRPVPVGCGRSRAEREGAALREHEGNGES